MKKRMVIAICMIVGLLPFYWTWRGVSKNIRRNEFRRKVETVYATRLAFQDYLEYDNGSKALRPTGSPTNYLLQIAKHFDEENGSLFQFGSHNGEECVMDFWGNPYVVIWAEDLNDLSRRGIKLRESVLKGFKIGECYMWSCGRNGQNDWGWRDDVP